ncbi:MAG TPA: formate/nitrite transporter family protein [Steroidobacteraceae bacterium]|nr:formate/nitrite transporter family protein [Steroidobacteraceae bacterium]
MGTGEEPAAETAGEARPLGPETREIAQSAAVAGTRRLQRPVLGEAITGLIGGLSIGFGAVAMAAVGGLVSDFAGRSAGMLAASLAFPVGFVILLIGKAELFTENFLVPVIGVFERRGTPLNLGRVWSVSLAANLLGAFIFAWLISRHGVLSPQASSYLRRLGPEKVSNPFWTSFTKAIFAGWLMTILTWLLLACETIGQRLAIIWMTGALIIVGDFNHSVISAAESFIAINLGAQLTYGQWFLHNLIPAVLGNMVGGVLFVTALFYLQHNALERSSSIRDAQEGRRR